MAKITGKIKWFDEVAHAGVIIPNDGSEEVTVLHSALKDSSLRTLSAGQLVEFETKEGQHGPYAVNVMTIS